MRHQKLSNMRRWRRANRVRKRLRGTPEQPRLSVFRSNKHPSCQLIDDLSGKTLAAASTQEKDLQSALTHGGNCSAAKVIGGKIAERALASGVKRVVFDRDRYKYHGRVAELANAARAGGLEF